MIPSDTIREYAPILTILVYSIAFVVIGATYLVMRDS
jgi:hypothetical protein